MPQVIPRFLLLALLTVVVAGCSVSPTQPPQAPVDDRAAAPEMIPAPQETAPEPAIVSPLPEPALAPVPAPPPQPQTRSNPAVIALLANAERSRESGDYRAAQGSLQRAQRIAPKDPEVYYSLAVVHMDLEDYDLAEQVALKGVSVAQGNPSLSHRLWKLIAR